jgi:hypothetical protein
MISAGDITVDNEDQAHRRGGCTTGFFRCFEKVAMFMTQGCAVWRRDDINSDPDFGDWDDTRGGRRAGIQIASKEGV